MQTLFAQNRMLLESSGYYFPHAGKREKDMLSGRISPGNAAVLSNLIEQEDWKEVSSWLKTRMEQARNANLNKMLLTNETLVKGLSGEGKLSRFEKLYKDLGIEVIHFLLVLRDPVDQALSLYKHRAKRGNSPPLEKWLQAGYYLPQHLSGLFKQLGAHKLTVRKYKENGDELASVFFKDWLNMTKPDSLDDTRVNPSLSLSELEVLRQIRQQDPDMANIFYERMLKIPVAEKSDDRFLKNFYKRTIQNFISGNVLVWEHCNRLLPEAEQLKIPMKAAQIDLTEYSLSFSLIQTEAWVKLQKQSRTMSFRQKLYFNARLRPMLAKIKSGVLKLFTAL